VFRTGLFFLEADLTVCNGLEADLTVCNGLEADLTVCNGLEADLTVCNGHRDTRKLSISRQPTDSLTERYVS